MSLAIVGIWMVSFLATPGVERPDLVRDRERVAPRPSTRLVGCVLAPDGRPAPGAVIVSSAGGEAVSGPDGSFELVVELPPEAESVEVTAVASARASRGTLVASARVVPPSLSSSASVGVMLLAPSAGCAPHWIRTFGGYPGADHEVRALAVVEESGGQVLYAGGSFTRMGGRHANGVASWDGARWRPLSSGVDGGSVYAIAAFDDGSGPALYVGGTFVTAGGVPASNVARWDGTSWSPLASGLDATVRALIVFDDGSGPALYAGGSFTSSGGTPVSRVARWDGASWSALGSGLNGSVLAFGIFDDGSGPALYAGGGFTRGIQKWTGATWAALPGRGLDDLPTEPPGTPTVNALAVFDDGNGPGLYVCGEFMSAGLLPAYRIARWDGAAWSALAGGLHGPVDALAVYDDGSGAALYAACYRTGNMAARYVGRWDGADWSSLGSEPSSSVLAFTVYDDGSGPALACGGTFGLVGDDVYARRIAAWDGASWRMLEKGLDGSVTALGVFDDGSGEALFATGQFVEPERPILRWNGSGWSVVGTLEGGSCLAMTVFDDGGGPALYAAGGFDSVDGVTANGIARWDGASWTALGSGLDGSVEALAVWDDGSGPALFVGGSFETAGGVAASCIAKWDGASWSPLGSGMASLSGPVVNALAVFDDGGGPALFAGGAFNRAGGITTPRIAKWDGAWHAVPSVTGAIEALAVFDDGGGAALYAAGKLVAAGGTPVDRIARYDGASWTPLGSGLNDDVEALVVFDDGSGPALIAGGEFTSAGGVAASHLARWDGASWSPLGGGVSGSVTDLSVRALAVFDDGRGPLLHVGGSFRISPAGDSAIARWGCPRKVKSGQR